MAITLYLRSAVFSEQMLSAEFIVLKRVGIVNLHYHVIVDPLIVIKFCP
mgnify:CR=1 FL=1